MVYKIIASLGSIASVVALFLVDTEWYWWKYLGVGFGILGTLYVVIVEIKEYIDDRPLTLNSQEQIKNYMYNWIETSGKVCVFSRDLSWVDDRIKVMMQSKGEDLCICAEKESPLINDLKKFHVNVYLYGGIGYSPCSRFTIIRANSTDRQIAITRVHKQKLKEKHTVYESKSEDMDKWLLSISTDLVELTKKVGELLAENAAAKQEKEGRGTNVS